MKHVKRWIVEIAPKRYALVDDPGDLEGWEDETLEIKLPASAAEMLDATMRAYYNVQVYLDAQWELAGKRAAAEKKLALAIDTNNKYHKILLENGLIAEEGIDSEDTGEIEP